MRSSIRTRLTVAFISLAIGPLLLVGGVLAWLSFTTQRQQALYLQYEVAHRVSAHVTAFFEELESQLSLVSQVQGLQGLDRDEQHTVLSGLLTYQDVFEDLILLEINDLAKKIQDFTISFWDEMNAVRGALGVPAETDSELETDIVNLED